MDALGRPYLTAILLCAVLCGCSGESDRKLLERADALLRKGELVEALSAADRGWRRWRDHPASEYHWSFRLKKAEIHLAAGDLPPAIPLVDPEPPPQFAESRARRWLHLGTVRLYEGRYPDAEAALEKAESLAVQTRSGRLRAEIALRQGTAEVREGQFDEAERRFEAALVFGRSAGDAFIEASARNNSGFLALNRNRSDEAIPHLEAALALYRGIGARKGVTSASGNLGKAWQTLGDLERATDFLSRAEKGARAIGDEHSRQVFLGGLGDIYEQLRQPQEAASTYREALASARRVGDRYSICRWLNALSAVSLDSGDVAAARTLNAEALELASGLTSADSRIAATLVNGRIAEAQGQINVAEKIYREVAGANLDTAVPPWEAQSLLSKLLWHSGRYPEAEAGFRQALVSLEQARSRLRRDEWQLSFQSAARRFYEDYVDYLMSTWRAADALAVAESSRARVLAGKLGMTEAGGKDFLKTTEISAFTRLARETGAVLVSYWLAPKRSFVWVLAPSGLKAFALPPEDQIRSLVDSYSTAIASGRDPIATSNDAGRRLARILLEPLDIPPGSRVILSPDGFLNALNLESLPVAAPEPHYWIDDVSIAVVPSLELARGATIAAPKPSLLLFGDPRPPAAEFASLPAAAREVACVRQRLARYEQTVYTAESAQPPAYAKAAPGRFSIIHFAAHATANTRDPLESAVVLSPAPGGYRLYARDILKLPLRAHVVTLSSCRGAGSRLYRGEGLVGFAWAFLHAGAKNVVAGLWDVNDASTGALMDVFYEALGKGEEPTDALRKAKLALIHSEGAWRKPYYWAPFEVFSRTPSFSVKRLGPERH